MAGATYQIAGRVPYHPVRTPHGKFYTISGIIARAVHTAVSLYAVAVVMCALIKVDGGSILQVQV